MIHDPTLVEAAAKALCAAYGTDPDDLTGMGTPYWKLYTDRVIPVLDAIMPLIEADMARQEKK